VHPNQLAARNHESTFPALAVFMLLISADLGFTLLHLIDVETGWLRAARISLEADGGPAEIFQYVKEFWAVLCMAAAFVWTRRAVFVIWAMVFLFLLVDDSMQLHENAGTWLGQVYSLPAPFGLRPKDVGELLFAAMICVAIIAGVGLTAWRGTAQCRRVSQDLGVLIVMLGLAGIVLDVVHVIAYFRGSPLAQVLVVLEDGGEMIVMSAISAYAFHLATHMGRTRFALWPLVKQVLAWDVTTIWRPSPAFSRTTLSEISVSPAIDD
jgi:hypothetical protein